MYGISAGGVLHELEAVRRGLGAGEVVLCTGGRGKRVLCVGGSETRVACATGAGSGVLC